MAVGILNPKDTTRSTTSRPSAELTGDGARKWWSDTLHTKIKAEDFNTFAALFRSLIDGAGIADTEGDEDSIKNAVIALVGGYTGKVGFAAFSDLASGATTDIGSVASNLVNVTGTTTITALGTAAAGVFRILKFASSLILTYNGTSLILPGAKDRKAYTNDIWLAISAGSGNWRLIQLSSGNTIAAARNFIKNAAFDIWQVGTSFPLTGNVRAYIADLWFAIRQTNSNATITQQTGFSGATFCCRMQRDAANANTGVIRIAHQIPSSEATQLQGKQVILSMDARCGADFSGTTFAAGIYSAAGTDELFNLQTTVFPSSTTAPAAASGGATRTPTTTAARFAIGPFTVPSDCTELVARISYQPAGTAGTNDYLEVTNVKLEIGTDDTPFERRPTAEIVADCERQFCKSFTLSTTPAQNAGAGSGEELVPAPVAGTNTERLPRVKFRTRMRSTSPAITIYNPAAANAHVRDETAPGDCSAEATSNITATGFNLTCTGNASTVAGGYLGFHYTADARL